MRLLVIDDEVFICEILSEFIKIFNATVLVDIANTVEHGLDLLNKNKYVMVFTDISMPGNYLRVVSAAQEQKSKIVLCSGHFFTDVEVDKTFTVLQKPFDLNEIFELLKREI